MLLALLFGAGLWMMLRSRPGISGFATGIGIGLPKLIALFYAPIFWLADQRRWRWTAGFLVALFLGEGVWLPSVCRCSHPSVSSLR